MARLAEAWSLDGVASKLHLLAFTRDMLPGAVQGGLEDLMDRSLSRSFEHRRDVVAEVAERTSNRTRIHRYLRRFLKPLGKRLLVVDSGF